MQKPRVKELLAFMTARESINIARQNGAPKPWTPDPILQRYRFCNVHREDDTVTKWIAKHWREPHRGNKDNWFAMAVARWINWPDTLADIGYPLPWDPARTIRGMKARREAGEKVWTGAYMIGTQGNAKDKIDFIVNDVLDPMYQNRAELRPRATDSLAKFNERLQTQYAMKGGFMGGQIIADIKYADYYLEQAPDWNTFAISGPGSRRGLNRVMGHEVDAPWKEYYWHHDLMCLLTRIKQTSSTLIEPLHAQDLQNCLCEFDKYERVHLGEGKPRSLYPGEG